MRKKKRQIAAKGTTNITPTNSKLELKQSWSNTEASSVMAPGTRKREDI